jgi:hypothetical protein
MPEYTTTQAAELLNTNRRNVQNYAKRHGLKKFGREYIITQKDIEGMKNELGKPGVKPAKSKIDSRIDSCGGVSE